uniref:Reverse transcriptase domain-containing protein n=1 Tax=Fagus sylvatica TaxID=28930 RepID=A0A2N9F7H7_FAGSY
MSDINENSLEQTSSPSPEEEDLIRRSTKKQKGDGSFLPPRTLRSYKDSLVNPEGYWQDHTMQETMHTEDTNEVTSDVEDNIDEDIPIILLSKAEKERINAPWRSALIIKAFGKSVGFKYMDFKIRMDYWKAINGGPWFINQQFLTIRRWSPGFRPSEAKISTTAVWARLPELPIELYDMNILRRIGNQLGSLLKVDARTMDNERGRYARLCVQIDLEQPLIPRIQACPSKIAPASPMSPKTPENTHPPSFEQDSSNFGKWMISLIQIPTFRILPVLQPILPMAQPAQAYRLNRPNTQNRRHYPNRNLHRNQNAPNQPRPHHQPQTPTPSIHTSTLSTTHTNNTISGELGSTQEGYTASHWRSPSEMASGMPDPILDTSRSRNGTSFKNSNPSNPCEYTVRPGSNQPDFRTSDCVSHDHAHIQHLPSMERTPSSDSWTSTDQENSEWHRDNIRATRCRSPRSHDHSHILGEHPNSHSLPDNRQHHHPGGNSSETPVIQIISRSPSIRHASRALLPSGDEPKCTNNSYPQSESPKQNPHQEERIFRGAGNPNFCRNFADLLRSHRPSIDVLVETRISGQRAEDISSMLGFNRVCRSEAVGFRGGIWLLWNSGESMPALNLDTRLNFWDQLANFASTHNAHWVVAGDFNDILSSHEKFSSSPANPKRISAFHNCLNTCNLLDLGFNGPRFTWTNKRDRGLVMERLDRFFCNPSWQQLFEESTVLHLPRVHSDHTPILLDTEPAQHHFGDRPFRFETIWLTDLSFPKLVHESWQTFPNNVNLALADFTTRVTSWNKQEFGNIFYRKRRLLARINGVQKALARHPSDSLLKLETDLSNQFQSVLRMEEEFWALKSRMEWSLLGDRNTSFFHTSVLCRRHRNKIWCLKDSMGNWSQSTTQLKTLIRDYFVTLYSTECTSSDLCNSLVPNGVSFSEEIKAILDVDVSKQEIVAAFKSFKPYKAPGPDGFHPVGKPELIQQFRPIGLCNTIYKAITKVLVNRLKPYLSDVVHPLQASFVPGRKASDNVILVQEIIHSMSISRSKIGNMAIKIDLEKAYDRLEWSFIRLTLQYFNLPQWWIDLIMSCISSSHLSILVNGEKTDSFAHSRGIRQGDPLSPYIFILCMEYLAWLIQGEVTNGSWKGIKVSRQGPTFSHIFFADDLVLFAKATKANCRTINKVLNTFCQASGQKINNSKSCIYMPATTSPSNIAMVKSELGIKVSNNFGKYLGVPIITDARDKKAFEFIIEKVRDKLAGWKAKTLSMAGRCTLINSVSSAIPTHVMQCCLIPSKTCAELDKLNRNFLWGDSSAKKKLHLIKWDSVSRPKEEGGLGIKRSRCRNKVLLAKRLWDFCLGSVENWAVALRNKYSPTRSRVCRKSISWKSLQQATPICDKGMGHLIQNGRTIKFWTDNWQNLGSIRNLISGPLLQHEESLLLNEFWDPNGAWCFDKLSSSVCAWVKYWAQDKNSPSQFPQFQWKDIFPVLIWTIWTARNKWVKEKIPFDINLILRRTKTITTELWFNLPQKGPRSNSETILVYWRPPPTDFFKLNTDGSAEGNPGLAGAGGIIRNHTGGWIKGFSRKIGVTNSLAAELWGLRDGLILAHQQNIKKIIIELDAKAVSHTGV